MYDIKTILFRNLEVISIKYDRNIEYTLWIVHIT